MESVTALLPMRQGSKRVPGKNTKLIAGRPLFFWILDTLHAVGTVAEIIITTNDPEVSSMLRTHGEFDKVRILDRPEELASDQSSMLDVIFHALPFVTTEAVLQVHATSPLLKASTLDDAINNFFSQGLNNARSVMGVTKFEGRLWSPCGKPQNHSIHTLLPSQEMPDSFLDCSALYLFSRQDFFRERNRTYGPPILHAIDQFEAWDIDYQWQFRVAEKMLEMRGNE